MDTADITADVARDTVLLRRAVALAVNGPIPDENPRVGAVVTDARGRLVGSGWHAGAGSPHAEVVALRSAGALAAGGTAYVSLEPCTHHGRTGPCVAALLEAGVSRVVYAAGDPNPVAGGGANALRAAGVRVQHVPVAGAELNRHWRFAVTHGRPFVTWKVAATLDGRVAAADGSSRWITGPASRADVHAGRATAGAVVVGSGTALSDDPALTVRDERGRLRDRQPLRVVVGRRPVSPAARLRNDDAWLQLTTHDPAEALAALHVRQIRHAWLEGGPTLAAAWLRAEVIDEVLIYLAPTLLGSGHLVVGDLGVHTLAAAHHLQLVEVARLDDDVRLTLRPQPGSKD